MAVVNNKKKNKKNLKTFFIKVVKNIGLSKKKEEKKKVVKKIIRTKTKNKKIKKVVKRIKVKTKLKIKTKVRVKKETGKRIKKKFNKEEKENHKLERFVGNPVIYPASGMHWESKATFNPTAFEHDGKVHVIYRAVGDRDISTLGYVGSNDGYNLSERTFRPIFMHKNFEDSKENNLIFYSSGGGWNGGAEDPRVTKIDDKLYITYTAFDGWGSVRIGLSSISLEDFLNKKWDWKKPVLISPPGQIHKNWAVFSEKINGKYAVIHSLSPKILINYFDDLDSLDGKKYINSFFNGKNPEWDSGEKLIRGIGPAPIKTKLGWLVLYHAMEKKDLNRYKLFAMILDQKDPSKILYHSSKPILEPDVFYENNGYKSGVIYSCGAVIKDGNLFVYYGGADMVSCVATADLDLFLEEFIKNDNPKLKKLEKLKKKK